MKSAYKACLAGSCAVGVLGAVFFHSRSATAAMSAVVPFTFATIDVPVPGAGSTMVAGINNLGDVVGSYNFIPGAAALGVPAGFLGNGFVWHRNGKFTTIPGPGPVNPQN